MTSRSAALEPAAASYPTRTRGALLALASSTLLPLAAHSQTLFSSDFESGTAADIGSIQYSNPENVSPVGVDGDATHTDWGNGAVWIDRAASSGTGPGFVATLNPTGPVSLDGSSFHFEFVLRRTNTPGVKGHYVTAYDTGGNTVWSVKLVDREDAGLANIGEFTEEGETDERQRQIPVYENPATGDTMFSASQIASGTAPDGNDRSGGGNVFTFFFGNDNRDDPVSEEQAGLFTVTTTPTGWTLAAVSREAGTSLPDFTTVELPFHEPTVNSIAYIEITGETVQAGGYWDNLVLTGTEITGGPDSDGDGIADDFETNTGVFANAFDTGTDPEVPDTDADGIIDGDEVNGETVSGEGFTSDPNLADTDGDGIGDFREVSAQDASGAATGYAATNPDAADSDGDGIGDLAEISGSENSANANQPTDPRSGDTDGDGMDDAYEIDNRNTDNATGKALDPNDDGSTDFDQDPFGDVDGDGLANFDEYDPSQSAEPQRVATRADTADTDGDGLSDFAEDNFGIWGDMTATGTHPLRVDTDGDGLDDGEEDLDLGAPQSPLSILPAWSDPNMADTDSDGVGDGAEIGWNTDPNDTLAAPPAGPHAYAWDGTTDDAWNGFNWSVASEGVTAAPPLQTGETDTLRTYVGDDFEIAGGASVDSDKTIRLEGGSLTVTASTLVSSGPFANGLDLGFDLGGGSSPLGTTAVFTDSTVVSTRGNGGNSFRLANASSISLDGGSLSVVNENGGAAIVTGGSTLLVTNGAAFALDGTHLQLDDGTVTVESGTITADGATNAFRSAAFNGESGTFDAPQLFNFTGGVGSATVVQTRNTDGAITNALAGKVADGYFSLDGVRITATDYDGGNLAAINAELESQPQGGRFFQVTESGGVQTLVITDTAVGGQAPTITNVSFDSNGDLLIAFTPAGTDLKVTSSANLVDAFTDLPEAMLESGSTVFRVPAAQLTADRDFFRIETTP